MFYNKPAKLRKIIAKQLDVSISMIGTIQQQDGLTFEKMAQTIYFNLMGINILHKPAINFKAMS